MSGDELTAKLGGEDVILLRPFKMALGREVSGPRQAFQKSVLGDFFYEGKKRGDTGAGVITLDVVKRLQFLWRLVASALAVAGIGTANAKTWRSRANCRPTMLPTLKRKFACRLYRICPFCWSRDCTIEYFRLGRLLFDKGSRVANRKVVTHIRQTRFIVTTPAEIESRVQHIIRSSRISRATGKSKRRLRLLDGWWRFQKIWVERMKDGKWAVIVEVTTLGTFRKETIPAVTFATKDLMPPKQTRKKKKDNEEEKEKWLPALKVWTGVDEALTRAKFRKFMLSVMEYKPELLKYSPSVTVALQRPLMAMKGRQFDCGGELTVRTKSGIAVVEDDVEPEEQSVESRADDDEDDTGAPEGVLEAAGVRGVQGGLEADRAGESVPVVEAADTDTAV